MSRYLVLVSSTSQSDTLDIATTWTHHRKVYVAFEAQDGDVQGEEAWPRLFHQHQSHPRSLEKESLRRVRARTVCLCVPRSYANDLRIPSVSGEQYGGRNTLTPLQTSPPLHHPQPLPPRTNPGAGSTAVDADALLYQTDADQESLYRGWQSKGHIQRLQDVEGMWNVRQVALLVFEGRSDWLPLFLLVSIPYACTGGRVTGCEEGDVVMGGTADKHWTWRQTYELFECSTHGG